MNMNVNNLYKSSFTTWVANRQTDKDGQKTIQCKNTREEGKHHPVNLTRVATS